MRGSIAGLLLVYSAISLPATGFVIQEISLCRFGDDKNGNVTLQYFIVFNHQNIVGYDSNMTMFLPNESIIINETMKVVKRFATEFNTNPDMLHYVESQEKRCKNEIKTYWNYTVERRERPSMEVFVHDENEDNLPLLICFVWGFYPDNITVSWIKNNKTVVKTETEAVKTGEWSYQVVSKLDLRDALPTDDYTCKVEHQSLEEPMTKTWRAGLTSIQIIKISVSSVIFALGLIVLISGVVCWRNAKRSDDCHFLSTLFRPWRHICAPCLPFSFIPLSREGSVTSDSDSSLISGPSQSLLDEERDLGEENETAAMDGQLIVWPELLAPFHQGCALTAVPNVDDDDDDDILTL
ncbi:HLA class II histocompatibility antigen, DM beta chain-like isoform X1 [Anomaloglossus baeobatrachus]|uniref:HLA class II histocompatibility antigen, DM beta chain-like isoform X1 n=1 Tax=Anomaloglossus baeobatrachus TaxID=238106 RepID=UPI003F4F5A57